MQIRGCKAASRKIQPQPRPVKDAIHVETLLQALNLVPENLFFDMQEFISLAGAEVYRGGAEREKRIYPGGPFDPLGLSKVCSPPHPAC